MTAHPDIEGLAKVICCPGGCEYPSSCVSGADLAFVRAAWDYITRCLSEPSEAMLEAGVRSIMAARIDTDFLVVDPNPERTAAEWALRAMMAAKRREVLGGEG